jgi:hypothetical protein
MPQIDYKDNVDEWVKQLRIAGISLQEAGAEAINKAASVTAIRYKKSLRSKTKLRNPKFTLGAVVILKAHAKRSSGKELRQMADINAIVGVKTLGERGEHYLSIMEIGGQKTGGKKTHNKPAIPMDTARGGNRNKPILPRYRLSKAEPQKISDQIRNAVNPRQEYAMMYSMARRGTIRPGAYQSDTAIYDVTRKRVTMVRKISDDAIQIKSRPLFGESVNHLDASAMDRFFIYAARKLLGKLEG